MRENGRRRVVVFANSDGSADMAAIVKAVRERSAGPAAGRLLTSLEALPGAGAISPHHACCRWSHSP